MGLFNKIDTSADLVRDMADHLGVSLSDAMIRNPDMEARRLLSAVLKCSRCTNQDGCISLLDCTQHLDQPPEYCENKDLFWDLKA